MLRLSIELEVADDKGRVLKRMEMESHSYLRQYIAMLRGILYHTFGSANSGNTIVKDITGTDTSYPYSGGAVFQGMAMNCPAASSEYGIVVGSGTTANSTTTYALASLIPHGTASGQLSYGSHTFDSLLVDGSTVYFKVIRTFTNNSGATITVKELGIYVKAYNSNAYEYVFCIARDVLSTPIDVPATKTLTVRYKFSITVS